MPTAYLVNPNDDHTAVLSNAGQLPAVPVEQMFQSGKAIGLDVAVVRTLGRLGDDRVLLCDLLDGPSGQAWAPIGQVIGLDGVGRVVDEWANGSDPAEMATFPWERQGWFADTLNWLDVTLEQRGQQRTGVATQFSRELANCSNSAAPTRESEVNELLRAVFDDVAYLRRELVREGVLTRSRGIYERARV